MTLSLTNFHGANQRNEKITEAETFRSGSGQILQLISVLQIPESSSSSAFITVQVKGPTQHFVKRKWMHITKAESLVFVQTDKPIYKPGQTGIKNQMSEKQFEGLEVSFSINLWKSWHVVICLTTLSSHWRVS